MHQHIQEKQLFDFMECNLIFMRLSLMKYIVKTHLIFPNIFHWMGETYEQTIVVIKPTTVYPLIQCAHLTYSFGNILTV